MVANLGSHKWKVCPAILEYFALVFELSEAFSALNASHRIKSGLNKHQVYKIDL